MDMQIDELGNATELVLEFVNTNLTEEGIFVFIHNLDD